MPMSNSAIFVGMRDLIRMNAPKRARERKGHGQEIRARRDHAVAEARDVVAHLMAAENAAEW